MSLTTVAVRALSMLLAAVLLVAIAPAVPTEASGPVTVISREVATSVVRQRVVELPIVASHIALHWSGHEEAAISVAFSADGVTFGEAVPVQHDEAGGHSDNGRTYGTVIWTEDARFVRVTTDRRLGQVSVVAINSRGPAEARAVTRSVVAASVNQPTIISRAGWGAKESFRFDDAGTELWPREFFPVQKLVVHHTAGRNNDPDPASTVRAIYHYQAVVRGWDDIGYNFLIDEAGRIYEGRYSREYGSSGSPTGEDLDGNSVVGAHVSHHNAGTVGIVLLGTLTNTDATKAARASLERLLAWKAQRHNLDPQGSGIYSNPITGLQKNVPNIIGHRDLAATLCPGGTFYKTLPALRHAVAGRISGLAGDTVPGAAALSAKKAPSRPGVKLTWLAPSSGGSPITAYRILRLKSGTFARIATVNGSKTSYRDGSTKSGKTYTYTIRAINALGVGPQSNRASAVAR